ncbi:hypothetical protein FISHEDRAFT_62531 [Fistulina hepatica ATCC 64428]|nr:hypothetical protein FISHEDRAFT_62531 [Fistulina hepatica ATCC 64428]
MQSLANQFLPARSAEPAVTNVNSSMLSTMSDNLSHPSLKRKRSEEDISGGKRTKLARVFVRAGTLDADVHSSLPRTDVASLVDSPPATVPSSYPVDFPQSDERENHSELRALTFAAQTPRNRLIELANLASMSTTLPVMSAHSQMTAKSPKSTPVDSQTSTSDQTVLTTSPLPSPAITLAPLEVAVDDAAIPSPAVVSPPAEPQSQVSRQPVSCRKRARDEVDASIDDSGTQSHKWVRVNDTPAKVDVGARIPAAAAEVKTRRRVRTLPPDFQPRNSPRAAAMRLNQADRDRKKQEAAAAFQNRQLEQSSRRKAGTGAARRRAEEAQQREEEEALEREHELVVDKTKKAASKKGRATAKAKKMQAARKATVLTSNSSTGSMSEDREVTLGIRENAKASIASPKTRSRTVTKSTRAMRAFSRKNEVENSTGDSDIANFEAMPLRLRRKFATNIIGNDRSSENST